MTQDPTTVAHRFAVAVTARDVDQVLDCFTPDAVYTDLFYGQFRDRAGLRVLFERMFTEGADHEWMMTQVVEQPDCTISEWNFAFTVSAAVAPSSGRSLRFRGVSVFETRDGLCHTYREYFDRGAALFALGIPAHTVGAILTRRPTVAVRSARSATLPR